MGKGYPALSRGGREEKWERGRGVMGTPVLSGDGREGKVRGGG